MKLTITIKGKPIAKKRPKFFRRGNHVGTYNAQETEEGRFRVDVASQIHQPADGFPVFKKGVPVHLECFFYFARPASHFGTGKNADMLKPSAPKYHTVKPDKDNLEKFVKDCMNGIAWHDDSQVVMGYQAKFWSKSTNQTVITIKTVD